MDLGQTRSDSEKITREQIAGMMTRHDDEFMCRVIRFDDVPERGLQPLEVEFLNFLSQRRVRPAESGLLLDPVALDHLPPVLYAEADASAAHRLIALPCLKSDVHDVLMDLLEEDQVIVPAAWSKIETRYMDFGKDLELKFVAHRVRGRMARRRDVFGLKCAMVAAVPMIRRAHPNFGSLIIDSVPRLSA
jgi:hypothetical protein